MSNECEHGMASDRRCVFCESPPPDPIAAILAVECPNKHQSSGRPCMGGDWWFCAARIRAAALPEKP